MHQERVYEELLAEEKLYVVQRIDDRKTVVLDNKCDLDEAPFAFLFDGNRLFIDVNKSFNDLYKLHKDEAKLLMLFATHESQYRTPKRVIINMDTRVNPDIQQIIYCNIPFASVF